MDTFQHAYTPALAVYAFNGSVLEAVVAGAIGAAPDILGAYGTAIKKDQYELYNKVHSFEAGLILFGIGFILSVLGFIYCSFYCTSWFYSLTIGCVGYILHLLLDTQTHGKGKSWWIPSERLVLEIAAWIILIGLSIFVNLSLAISCVVWTIGVYIYCERKYL